MSVEQISRKKNCKLNLTSKIPNRLEADQLAINKHGRGVELGITEKQLQLVARAGFEPWGDRVEIWRPKQSAMLLPARSRHLMGSPGAQSFFACLRFLTRIIQYT